MSKNHPHDNIYSILGKLEALQPTTQEKHDATVKAIYESVEAQGSILKGLREVSPIEARLNKMFAEEVDKDKFAALAEPKDKITYADKIAGAKKNDEDTCNECGMCETDCGCDHETNESVTKGPDTYGTSYYKSADFTGGDEEKTKRVVNKGVKGRPKKDAAPVYNKINDPFGRVPDKAPKGKKGTFVKGVATEGLREGINFAEMIKRKHQTVDEMLAELQADIKTFKDSGHCSDLLRDCMEVVSFGKDQIADEAVRPENIPAFQRKQQGQNFPVTTQQVNAPGDNISDIRNIRANTGRNPNTGTPNFRDTELNELARLAGVNVKEGTMKHGVFSDNENEAKAAMDKLQSMESLPAGEASDMLYDIIFDDMLFDIIDDVATTDPEQDLLQNPDFLNRLGELTGEITEVSRGEYISQQDDEAEQAGQDKFDAFGQEFDTDEVEETYANEPEEEYGTIDQITSQGDDLNRQKKQFKKEYPGDNPMTSESALALEAKLAAEYESIKKVTR